MTSVNWKSLLLGAGLVLLGACTHPTQHVDLPEGSSDGLFTLLPAMDRQALRKVPGAHAYLAALVDDPATEDIRLVEVNYALVSSATKQLSIPLPDGSTVHFNQLRINDTQAGMTGWIGDVPSARRQQFPSFAEVGMDPFNWISLMREGEQVVANIHVNGQAYRLEPVGGGKHALVKFDEARLPADVEVEAPEVTSGKYPLIGKKPSSSHSTIRVLIVTTDQSRFKFPDNRLQVAQALQDANQFMINSKVDITFELAGFFDASYDETGRNYSEQLADLRSDNIALGNAVYMQRHATRADLVAMLSTVTNVCGVAYTNATKASGYSVFSCIGGTLAHELGHNLGARHVWKTGDEVRNPPYVHGYEHKTAPVFHTLMATSHGAIPYFSNPRLRYQGEPIGTQERNDVARRFNERREVVEAFYPSAR